MIGHIIQGIELHISEGVRALHLERDRLSGKRLDEDLHGLAAREVSQLSLKRARAWQPRGTWANGPFPKKKMIHHSCSHFENISAIQGTPRQPPARHERHACTGAAVVRAP
jgi:hypothetical protein